MILKFKLIQEKFQNDSKHSFDRKLTEMLTGRDNFIFLTVTMHCIIRL